MESDSLKSYKESLHYTVGTISTEYASIKKKTVSKKFIYTLNDVLLGCISNLSTDIEAFSKHANRKTINTADIILAVRKNESLSNLMRHKADQLLVTKGSNTNKRSKKNKEIEEDHQQDQNDIDVENDDFEF